MVPFRLTIALLAVPATALAHHSGLYDESNIVAIAGTITAIAWINPHVRLTLATAAEGGSETSWEVEGTSINALERWGVQRDWFVVGERISVRGPQSRFEPNAMIGATAELADGRRVVLWPNVAARLRLADTGVDGLFPPPAAAAADSAATAVDRSAPQSPRGIFRVWTPRGRPAADPAGLPLRESAREAARAYQPLRDDPALQCIAPGLPVMLDTPYPVQFVEDGDRIVMRFEEWDGVRTVYMNPRNGPRVQDPSPYGVSFGRWEAETLAIFTTYINYPYFDDLGTPQSAAVTVLERYTPSGGGERLDWVVTVTDEATFTQPVVRRGFMAYEAGESIKAYNCTLVERPGIGADGDGE
jgi:hypothetical protein